MGRDGERVGYKHAEGRQCQMFLNETFHTIVLFQVALFKHLDFVANRMLQSVVKSNETRKLALLIVLCTCSVVVMSGWLDLC